MVTTSFTKILKSISPESVKVQFRTIRSWIYRFIDTFTPYLSCRKYLGKRLFYIKGPSTVDRIRFLSPNPYYEPQVVKAIKRQIEIVKKNKSAVTVFDIGANIGLISLALVDDKSVTVHAFEPGIKQFSVLQTNIAANKLFSRIFARPIAISDKTGLINFFWNTDSSDGSGDGLRPTERGGNKTSYQIESDTLDNWTARYSVYPDIIKIDTEGAESLILQGGTVLLQKYRPILFIEISPLNLTAFGLTPKDMLTLLQDKNYEVYTVQDEKCTFENINKFAEIEDMFLALPRM